MEKEQKKLLLVAVSVGVFLLVTITAAIILIGNRTQPQEAAISWTAPQQQYQPVIDPQPEININVDCENSDLIVEVDRNDGDRLIIQIPAPTTAAVPNEPVATAPPKTTATPAPAASTAAAQPKTAAKPAATASAAAKPAPAPAPKTVTDYWIQTGAFSARVRAEDAKETLAEKGFVSIIENSEVNGQLWYRVRLGPYTSQREADYWLALVKSINGFGESQVRQTARTQ